MFIFLTQLGSRDMIKYNLFLGCGIIVGAAGYFKGLASSMLWKGRA